MSRSEDTTVIRLPRGLLLGWSLWLLGAWAQAFVGRSAIAPGPEYYQHALRTMFLVLGLGLAIVWPLARLSLAPAGRFRRRAFVDFLALVAPLQIVLWPTRLLTRWPLDHILLADLMLCTWTLLLAAVVGLGLSRTSARHRTGAMALCMVLAGGGPLVALFAEAAMVEGFAEWARWSPVSAAWHLVDEPDVVSRPREWLRLAILAAAAGLAWVGLILWPARPAADATIT